MSASRAVIDKLGLVALIVGFAVPLVSRLVEPEMRSDESIYAYSVERMLETGDWMTPRSIPTDGRFLEKPPLKIWIVAAAMKLGLVPHDDAGHRFFDGLFGGIGFLYVFLFARRLGGAGAGLVAALTLFTMEALAFDHGLRSANMEAAVFLCYCGGVYHFGRWAEAQPGDWTRTHAWSAAACFVLGFMSKFVAAFFLPVVAIMALAWRRDGLNILRGRWTEWVWPTAGALAVCAPWFVYQSVLDSQYFWSTIFGAHVYQRFTSFVDPTHLAPWYFYFSHTWLEIARAGSGMVTVAGFGRLGYLAWRGEPWFARLALVWFAVPFVLISLGTSKLPHYAYPFWPPIAIGAGVAFTWALKRLDDRFGPAAERAMGRWIPKRAGAWTQQSAGPRRLLITVALALAVLSAATALYGPVRWTIGDTTLFRNSSILRPLFFAVVLVWIAGYSRNLLRLVAVTALALLLPFSAYAHKIERLSRIDHPIREMRDCMRDVKASGAAVGEGVLAASGRVFHHAYYFYLWREGPYIHTDTFSMEQTLERLTKPGAQTPVLIARPDYEALVATLPLTSDLDSADNAALRLTLLDNAARFDGDIAVLFPGPFAPCAPRLLAASAFRMWERPPSAVRPPGR